MVVCSWPCHPAGAMCQLTGHTVCDGCHIPWVSHPLVQGGLGSSSGPRGSVWGWGYEALSARGVLVLQSGSPGPGFLPPLGLHAWGAAGGFPLLLKIRSKNSTGFWHGHRTGCRGNAAVGEEGGREALALGSLGATSTPRAGRHRGQPLSVPLPISVLCMSWLLGAAWFPPCSSFWVCWRGFYCPGSQGEASQILPSHGWHSWSPGDGAVSCGQCRALLLSCL